MSKLKSLVESMLSEDVMLGIKTETSTFTQKEKETDTIDEKAYLETFVITRNGKVVWEGPAKDKNDAMNRAIADGMEDEVTNGKVVVTMKKDLKESEEQISLSPKSFRTLYNCFIAECMVNEAIEIDETLENSGLISEGKVTQKGKDYLKLYLPTIFAS